MATITYGHIYGFWLQACEELSPESNSFKVYIHPTRDFKILPIHNLEKLKKKRITNQLVLAYIVIEP